MAQSFHRAAASRGHSQQRLQGQAGSPAPQRAGGCAKGTECASVPVPVDREARQTQVGGSPLQGLEASRTFCEQNTTLCVFEEPRVRGEDSASGPQGADLQLASPPHAAQSCPSPQPDRNPGGTRPRLPTQPGPRLTELLAARQGLGSNSVFLNLQTTLT